MVLGTERVCGVYVILFKNLSKSEEKKNWFKNLTLWLKKINLHVGCNHSDLKNKLTNNIHVHSHLKVLANEDTLLRTHCCRHKCFPICPCVQHLLRTQKMFLVLVSRKHFVSATNVSQFAQHGNTTFILLSTRLHAQETL